jgi:hypothetical protein
LGAGVGGSAFGTAVDEKVPAIIISTDQKLTVTGVIASDGGNGGNQSGTAGTGGASTMGPGGKGGDMGAPGFGGLAGDIRVSAPTTVPPDIKTKESQIPGIRGKQNSEPGKGGSGHPDGDPGRFIPG